MKPMHFDILILGQQGEVSRLVMTKKRIVSHANFGLKTSTWYIRMMHSI